MKNIKICKKCWKERQKKEQDIHTYSYRIGVDVPLSGKDEKNWSELFEGVKTADWQFQYCDLENPFDENGPPPDACPYILEHTIYKKPVKKRSNKRICKHL